ncbi:ABC transporter permease, partial [Acidobacteriota bacterium]
LQCLCKGEYDVEDSLKQLREELAGILPETRVVVMEAIATARQRQRLLVERYFNFIFPIVAVVVIAWMGILMYLNVRDRLTEIGMMRALGFGSGTIGFLFFGKGILWGISGAAAGYLAGTFAAEIWGPGIFLITAQSIQPSFPLFIWTLTASLLAAAVSVFIPTALAVSQDPARILQGE